MFKPMCVCLCGPTCEVFLSELDQWENHAVSHLVGQLRVQRVQLDHTKQIIQKYQDRSQKMCHHQTSWGISIYFTAYSDICCQLFLQQEKSVQTVPLLHHKKPILWNSAFHEENCITCCLLRYWKQGHILHKQANPAIILYAYQQATLQHLTSPHPV